MWYRYFSETRLKLQQNAGRTLNVFTKPATSGYGTVLAIFDCFFQGDGRQQI
jgi:hypothetical protein